mgnify:FL=1|jgi:ribosomal protein S7|tara:strand:+ start:4644 stop:4841 length:198 start_codon:yes stop_codon:yes gene_type:complete
MNSVKKHFIDKATSSEVLKIVNCLDQASRAGLTVEVVYTALQTIKQSPSISPLLAMQIAVEDWDI